MSGYFLAILCVRTTKNFGDFYLILFLFIACWGIIMKIFCPFFRIYKNCHEIIVPYLSQIFRSFQLMSSSGSQASRARNSQISSTKCEDRDATCSVEGTKWRVNDTGKS